MELNVSSWKEFRLDELFDFVKGKRLTKADMVPGQLNYLGAISDNNGVRDHIEAESSWDGNCITVNYNGSVGEAFYQKDPFWPSDDVNCLYAKGWAMTEQIALFLCTVIKANKYRFSYGRKWTLEKMKESLVRLPATASGEPNWDFMQGFIADIQNRERESSRSLKQSLVSSHDRQPISFTNYGDFYLGDLFTQIYKAKAYAKNAMCFFEHFQEGCLPFVTRTDSQNGVDVYVAYDDQAKEEGGCMIIGDTTATVFYQEGAFVAGDHIVVCRAPWLDLYTGLYIRTLIQKEKYRYSYGRAFTMDKIKKTVVHLPIDNSGIPDWNRIRLFIKGLPFAEKMGGL